MKTIHKHIRSFAFFVFILSLALISGCTTKNLTKFYVRTTSSAPELKGKSVAVLPPMAATSEVKNTLDSNLALNTVFCGNLAGIQFSHPETYILQLQQNPEAFNDLRRQVTQRLPAHITAEGEETLLFENNVVSGKTQPYMYKIYMKSFSADSPLAPEQLDFSALKLTNADYVLVSAPYGEYVKVTRIAALYGILPFMGSGSMHSTPRGVFALYESTSGKKVWEAQIGSLIDHNTTHLPYPLAYDVVLGAAYLVTGNIEMPLERMISILPGDPSQDQKSSTSSEKATTN